MSIARGDVQHGGSALQFIRVLEQLKESRGLAEMIRVDNAPEFISHRLDAWCKGHKIMLAYIQPGKPTQNAYVRRFNGSIRCELLSLRLQNTGRSQREPSSGSTITTTLDPINPSDTDHRWIC